MKSCELCTQPARVHCDADAANLCWECDKRVHCANFLVARHSRHLLCRSCQATTPWTAVGSELGRRTMSVCHDCTTFWWRKHHRMRRNGEEEEEEESEGENNNGDGEGEYEEDGANQMVPILLSVCTPPPPAASSSNTDGAVSSALCSTPCDGVPPLKRNRDVCVYIYVCCYLYLLFPLFQCFCCCCFYHQL